jgi:uncharacterized membrane protein HdeD (DUF308 family)
MSATTTGKTLFRYYWGTFVVRALIAIIFGIVALVWTSATFSTLFGVFILIDGLLAFARANEESGNRRTVLLLEGLVGIVPGVLVLIGSSGLSLVLLAAIWAIVSGLTKLAVTVRSLAKEWALGLSGLLSLLLGIALLVFTGLASTTVTLLIAIYAIVFGVLALIRTYQFKS